MLSACLGGSLVFCAFALVCCCCCVVCYGLRGRGHASHHHDHSSSPSRLYSGAESLACRAAEGISPHTCEASSRAKREHLVVFVVCGMICVRFALCVFAYSKPLCGSAVRNDF